MDGDATLDSELGGTSFDELISQCAALKIVMEPSIPEELSAIKRKNAGRKRERQLKHALRKRICYAIDNARASARESTSGADAENEPDEEEWRQRLASFDFYNIPIASAFDFYNCVGIVPGINALAARTEAHAIAVLLYARQHIVRPLAVDGSAMRTPQSRCSSSARRVRTTTISPAEPTTTSGSPVASSGPTREISFCPATCPARWLRSTSQRWDALRREVRSDKGRKGSLFRLGLGRASDVSSRGESPAPGTPRRSGSSFLGRLSLGLSRRSAEQGSSVFGEQIARVHV